MVNPAVNSEKLPPHNVDAEEAVIGALLIDPEAVLEVSTFLKPEDFYREKNAWAYEACLALYDHNEAIDQITVANEVAQKGRLEAMGGAAYLSHLISLVPTSVDVKYYAQIVHRTALARRLITAGTQITALGYDAGSDIDSALSKAEDILFGLRHTQSARDFVHIKDVLGQYLQELSPTPKEEGHIGSIVSGFKAIDNTLGGGLQRGDMVVLAARPSMGKTSLAMNIARNAAVQQKAHVAIFSLEMSAEQLVQRLISSESNIDSTKIRLGSFHDSPIEEEQIMDAVGLLSEAPIYVDDSPMLQVSEMRSKARRLHNDRRIDLVIIDYMQLMHSGRRQENRVQEVSEISLSCKALARELNIPVLVVSQLSRAPEQRQPHTPMLSDLRESGSIEQDADVVAFIYREEHYTTQEDWERTNPDKPFPKGIADIIFAKHRNGPVGTVQLSFSGRTAKFGNIKAESEAEGN